METTLPSNGGVLSRGCPVNSPHRNIGCLHGGENGEAINDPYAKLIEPVQDIEPFLQNLPKGNRAARFVEQDMPSCQKLFGLHIIKFTFFSNCAGISVHPSCFFPA